MCTKGRLNDNTVHGDAGRGEVVDDDGGGRRRVVLRAARVYTA